MSKKAKRITKKENENSNNSSSSSSMTTTTLTTTTTSTPTLISNNSNNNNKHSKSKSKSSSGGVLSSVLLSFIPVSDIVELIGSYYGTRWFRLSDRFGTTFCSAFENEMLDGEGEKGEGDDES